VAEKTQAECVARGIDPAKAHERGLKKAGETLGIGGIGPEIVGRMLGFIADQENREIAFDLWTELDVQPLEKVKTKESAVSGKTVVFTGTLVTMSRDEAKAQAEKLGAKASGSISAKTHLVVAGPGAGKKIDQAKALGIETIDEEGWLAIVRAAE